MLKVRASREYKSPNTSVKRKPVSEEYKDLDAMLKKANDTARQFRKDGRVKPGSLNKKVSF